MQDRKKLNQLLDLFEDLIKVEGNEWLIEGILKKIEKISGLEEIAKNSVIQNIHEYCIEEKIDKQAIDFYGNFAITEIKKQLIQDYQKMEHERRRDDFENFCLCIYQQIENITNFLFETMIESSWKLEKNKIAVKSFFDETKRQYVLPKSGGISLEQLVFQGTDASKWFANRKFRAVLYYFYFNKNVPKDEYIFNSIYFLNEEIYQMRNQNHRGGTPTSYQKKTLDKIKGNEARYYFKFYGFLQDFVNRIDLSFVPVTNKVLKDKNSREKNPQKNTLGANNPVLEKLRQQLMKNG